LELSTGRRRAQRCRTTRRTSPEVGASSTELVIVFPAVLLVIMLAFQFALYLHAAQIAEAGAQEAVEAAQGEHAAAADGEAAAYTLLRQLGALRSVQVSVERGPSSVTAQVTGRAQRLLPGFGGGVDATAHGPVERFVPEPAP
jgi:Flp pilus assembly protein TadG